MAMKNALDKMFNIVFSLKKNVKTQIDVQALDITPMHFGVIRIVRKHQPCTVNVLAQHIERDKAQVTRLVNSLVEQNMISREPNPEDKRSQFLNLEPSGEKIFQKLEGIGEIVTQKMFKGISKKDQDLYEEITIKILENLSN